jgi:hypothetical protein
MKIFVYFVKKKDLTGKNKYGIIKRSGVGGRPGDKRAFRKFKSKI